MTISIIAHARKTLWALVLTGASGFAAPPADGQTFLPDPVERATVTVQLEKPFLPGSEGLAFYSSILEADAIFSLGPGKSLQIGAPLAIADADFVDGTSVYLGNVRASLLFGEPDALSGYVGVTLPTASNIRDPELAVVVGALPWLNQHEKWSLDAFSARGAVIPSWPLDSGGRLGLHLGGAAVTPNDFENLFVYTRVDGWGRFPVGDAELRADLGTSYAVNSDDGFGRQFTAYLGLGASLTQLSGRPGLFMRVPLDGDARQALDFSVGVSARF